MTREQLIDRVRNCFLSIAIGDAMGMPVETMTRAQILTATGGKGVTGYIDPVQRRITDTVNLKAGTTTDDWFLTKMVAEALIEAQGFDATVMARWHVHAYKTSVFGWGGTTKRAIEQFIRWFETNGKDGRHPELPAPSFGQNKGLGNGVGMKVAPLALWHAIRQGSSEPEPLMSDVIKMGLMTHSHVDATITAVGLAATINRCLYRPVHSVEDIDGCFEKVVRTMDIADVRLQHVGKSEASERFVTMGQKMDLDDEAFADAVGTGCNALESVTFALGTFLHYPTEITKAILSAVNAGGDTDTTASMVGALCGLNIVDECDPIPQEWIDGLLDKGDEATKLATRFVDAALK